MIREGDGDEACLLVVLRPDDDGVVVAEVIEEGQIEGEVVGLEEFADVLRLVAVGDGDEELCGGGERLTGSVENA